MAHVTCLAAARHALLARAGWDVEARGLRGAPRIRILSSANRHGSIDRALRLLGIGTDSLEFLATTDAEALDPSALEDALRAQPETPPPIVGDRRTQMAQRAVRLRLRVCCRC
jgi:glutamate/tyrosine decarboxylase-like PLP-dependent enzyme